MNDATPPDAVSLPPLGATWAMACSVVWAALYAIGYATSAITPVLGIASVIVLVVLAMAYRRRGTPRADLPWAWRSVDRRGLVVGLVIGGLSAAATLVVLPVLQSNVPWLAAEVNDVYRRSGASLAFLPVVVLIACTEEILWRGVLQSALVARVGPVLGVSGSAVIYAMAQMPVRAWSVIAIAFVLGAFWGGLRFRTGALWASMGAHTVWTLSQVILPLMNGRA